MNTIYKVVWNDLLNLFQVVNELTRSRGKKNSIGRGGGIRRKLWLA